MYYDIIVYIYIISPIQAVTNMFAETCFRICQEPVLDYFGLPAAPDRRNHGEITEMGDVIGIYYDIMEYNGDIMGYSTDNMIYHHTFCGGMHTRN